MRMQLAIIFVVLWVALSVGKKTTTTVKISTLNKLTRQVKRAKHIVKKLSVTKRFLYRPPLVVFSKTTRYNVCARPYTQEEATKRDELKALIDKSKDRYINNHQQCPANGKKRELQAVQDEFAHIHGTQVIPMLCTEKRDMQSNTLNMCKECAYTIVLPSSYFPRYHLHFTCDENGDHSCFSGGGVCVMNKLTKTLKHDQHEHGPDLNQWVNKPVEFTGSCSCQIINDDIFSDLV